MSIKMEFVDFEADTSDENANLNFPSDDEKMMKINLLLMTAARLVFKNRAFIEKFLTTPQTQQKLFLIMTDCFSTPEIFSLRCFR